MGKDPAFLFYPSDFMVGTALFSHDQRGKYVTLLCYQHQLGHLKKEDMLAVCGREDEKVFSKFEVDSKGLYFNARLEKEKSKRSSFCESRRENASARHDQIQEVFAHFCFTLKKKILLSPERRKLIEKRLAEGRTVAEMKRAIDNFSKDPWEERYKFCDLVYCIGVRNKEDLLDRWLATKPDGRAVPAVGHPETCKLCHGKGIIQPPGGKAVTCFGKNEDWVT